MNIKIHNTLSKNIEIFKPIKENTLSMYNCGPTVYDSVHIGNLRTFVFNDLLKRTFKYLGYEVIQAMNLTDVDDKTIKRSKKEEITLKELTDKYTSVFFEDLDALNILRPEKILSARENIDEMVNMINILLDKKIAYKAEDGIYFSIDKFPEYGKLSDLEKRKDKTNQARIKNDEYDKEQAEDFALWKFYREEDGAVFWDAPFGKGRPGWHIECSAMSQKALGQTIDIHTGGTDLMFPHHENEIAQSECATGKKFVNYWMHGAFLNMAENKMGKSKGNVVKLATLIEENISPLSYRYWLLTAHYRTVINFSFDALKQAQQALFNLSHITIKLNTDSNGTEGKIITEYKKKFEEKIADDINIPEAMALTWNMLKDQKESSADRLKTLIDFDSVFGLNLYKMLEIKEKSTKSIVIPEEIQALAEMREEARKNKDWAKSDILRQEIEDRGYEIIDDKDGFRINER